MKAYVYNDILKQGTTYELTATYTNPDGVTPIDLTGCTARMQARASYDDATTLFDLTVGSGITITAVSGILYMYISPSVTATFPPGEYVYDLVITLSNGIDKVRLVEGRIVVTAGVTR